jgi:hypothetical protein
MVAPYGNYRLMHAFELVACSTVPGPLVVLHYDTFFQEIPERLTPLSHQITRAKKTTALSLFPSCETLLYRNRSRMITEIYTLCLSPARYWNKFLRRFRYLHASLESYKQTGVVVSALDSWQQFLTGFDIGVHIVYANDGNDRYEVDDYIFYTKKTQTLFLNPPMLHDAKHQFDKPFERRQDRAIAWQQSAA